jgi:plasmid rolling circle replication initiator protein Rep
MKTVNKQGYITEKEAAKLLGKHERWLQNDRYEANKGEKLKIPFIKRDKRVFYKKEDILKFKGKVNSVTSKKLKPSNLQSNRSVPEDKIHTIIRETNVKVEELMRRIKALEEKRSKKGWFARLFS